MKWKLIFEMESKEQLEILKQGTKFWNNWRRDNPSINVNLCHQNCSNMKLQEIDFSEANLVGTIFNGTDLTRAKFHSAILNSAKLCDANLTRVFMRWTSLYGAQLVGANLKDAMLTSTNLTRTNLTGADLTGANLTCSNFVQTYLDDAILSDVQVYGISAWDIKVNKNTIQNNLTVTPVGKAKVSVDNLEIAQFIHLLLDNDKIRDVINTIGNKGVLILGRFTDERKAVLDSIRRKLRKLNYVPMMFDFEKPTKKDLTETVQLLANMSKFVIADITEAKSIPQELSHIIPNFPSVPVRPIILSSERKYAMFERWEKYKSVLPVFEYDSEKHLLDSFRANVIMPVENWDKEQDENKKLKAENEQMRKELEELKRNLSIN